MKPATHKNKGGQNHLSHNRENEKQKKNQRKNPTKKPKKCQKKINKPGNKQNIRIKEIENVNEKLWFIQYWILLQQFLIRQKIKSKQLTILFNQTAASS